VSELAASRRGLPLRVKMRHEAHFVEELTARHETPVGQMVPLSAIEPNPGQPRSAMGDLSDLIASIRDKGILEPILVRKSSPQVPGHAATQRPFQIIAGERRYRAATEAGLYDVPVIVMDVSEQEALEIALLENLQRKDLTPFEEAEGYRALGERHTYTHEEIAKAVGKSRSAVTESLSLLQVSPKVRAIAEALGVGAKSLLLEIAKAPDEANMLAMLERVAESGLTRDDLRNETRRSSRGRGAARKKPYVFKFRAPSRNYSLALTFKQSEVDRTDLIAALEEILGQLREQ
jgi:ParB family transcriptional regulator, chromosome partitioning protein